MNRGFCKGNCLASWLDFRAVVYKRLHNYAVVNNMQNYDSTTLASTRQRHAFFAYARCLGNTYYQMLTIHTGTDFVMSASYSIGSYLSGYVGFAGRRREAHFGIGFPG